MSLDFFNHVINLKTVPRQGWINKLQIQRPESVADHSYSVSVMAMIFSDLLNMNTQKILKMALLHDLAESLTGDITPDSISKKDKISIENNAMMKILTKLNPGISKEYDCIWKEYLDGRSPESRLLHQIDKLEMALQARAYQNLTSKQTIEEFFDSAELAITNNILKEILEQIRNTSMLGK